MAKEESTQKKSEKKKSSEKIEESREKKPLEHKDKDEKKIESFEDTLADKIMEKAEGWTPKTELGKKVKAGEITDIEQFLDKGLKIRDSELVDILIPDLETELLLVGQAKGKFGGGKRRIFTQTQKKSKEGNKISFKALAAVGNKDGLLGVGEGKSKETVPAREKAIRTAKTNIIKIRRGCGSWLCTCSTHHSIPFAVEGKSGSCWIRLMPAPRGTGLKIEKECAKVLKLAGIQDIWSKTKGQTRSKINMMSALMKALRKLHEVRVTSVPASKLKIVSGSATREE